MNGFSPRRIVERAVERAGYELTAKWRVPSMAYTRRVQTLFRFLNITTVIDIGANAGQFRDQMRQEIGFNGPIYSFEPDPTMAAKLAQRAETDPNWTIFPIALGAVAGTMEFNIMRDPVYNSFNTPRADRAGGHEYGNTVVRTIEVEVRTLDAMAHTFKDLAHTYLKLDTQGFDLEVVKGGPGLVGQIPALQTEVSVKPIYLGCPSMEQSISTFSALGFDIADMFLVSTDGQQRAVEFDCVMIRDGEQRA